MSAPSQAGYRASAQVERVIRGLARNRALVIDPMAVTGEEMRSALDAVKAQEAEIERFHQAAVRAVEYLESGADGDAYAVLNVVLREWESRNPWVASSSGKSSEQVSP